MHLCPHSSSRTRRLHLFFEIAFFISLLGIFCGLSSLAGAAVPTSVEATTTFIGRNNQSVNVAQGLSYNDVVTLLQQNYGTAKPNLSGLTFIINGSSYPLTRAEMNTITPASINFTLLASAVLVNASTSPEVPLNTNNLISQMIDASALDKILVSYIAKSQTPAKDISYAYNAKAKKLRYLPATNGLRLTKADARAALYSALSQFAAQGYQGSVTTPNAQRSILYPAKTTKKQLGKAIFIRRSSRKLFLYNQGKVVSTYRVAVGMRGFATPTGNFYIGVKRTNPSWNNPGSPWAKNMPKTIKPGYSNPLGLRAMNIYYVNGGDTGYRIHGTSNIGSIGRAASHGCVRVANANVVKLFKQVPIKTPVFIR